VEKDCEQLRKEYEANYIRAYIAPQCSVFNVQVYNELWMLEPKECYVLKEAEKFCLHVTH